MTRTRLAWKLAKAAARAIFARYEAAQPNSGRRSYIYAAVQDARLDINKATRAELLRKARYFERNNAIVNKLADLFEQYTVGNGLQVIPASSDQAWNERALEVWGEWCNFCDISSLAPFNVVQSLIARTLFIDGEIFVVKTRGESGRPRIQLIEGHRIETPPDRARDEGERVIDGVEIDTNGRPSGYWVKNVEARTGKVVFNRLDAGNVIHVFEPSRPGQYRGLTFFYPVLNLLHDLDDLLLLEAKAAKDAAEVTNIITNEAGEIDVSDLYRKAGDVAANATNLVDAETRYTYYRDATGGRTVAMKPGDKMEQFRSDRPTVASREYWDYLTSSICAGVGISKLLVFPWSMQGTVTRADLDSQATFFRCRSEIIGAASQAVFVYAVGNHLGNDKRLAGAPKDWAKTVIRPPKSVNVDVGRNSSAMLAELQAGCRTFQDIYAEVGQDWRVALAQRADEAAYIGQLAEERGLDPTFVSEFISQSIINPNMPAVTEGNP